jgi:hypothetical protein
MKAFSRTRPTPAMVVAVIALVAAMSGAAVALPGKGDVKSNDIAKAAVKSKHLIEDAVKSKHVVKNAIRSQEVEGKSLKGNDLKDGAIGTKQIKDDAVTSQQVEAGSLNDTDMSDYEAIGDGSFVRVTATEAASEAAAQAAAPETELFTKGQLTIYAKCFRDTTAGATFGEIYARTSANGAILQGTDTLPAANATLLDTTTAEEDAEVDTQTITAADSGAVGEAENVLIAPDGTDLQFDSHIAVKQGTFPGGNGAFGDGNVCLFGGVVAG